MESLKGELQSGTLWYELETDGELTIGVTEQGLSEIGQEVEGLSFPEEGADLDQGEIFLELGGSDGKLEVKAPASGIIHGINSNLQVSPNLIVEDPLDEGWLVKIKIEDASELKESSDD